MYYRPLGRTGIKVIHKALGAGIVSSRRKLGVRRREMVSPNALGSNLCRLSFRYSATRMGSPRSLKRKIGS